MKIIKIQAHNRNFRPRRRAAINALLLTLPLLLLLLSRPLAQAQTFTLLHTFSGKGDGKYPDEQPLRNNLGTLYGTTDGGGSLGWGTVFEIDAHGKETVLHNFWGGDGTGFLAASIRDKAGNIYGTASQGGTPEGGGCSHGCGAIFKLDPSDKLTLLYAFTGGADGGLPVPGLVQDELGNLYGATTIGGDLNCFTEGCGVVFKLDKNDKETVLYTFTGGADGMSPNGLIRDEMGNLYGVTAGGPYENGTVFKLDTAGKKTVLYSFTGGADGSGPNGPLVRDSEGNFYGTANSGGGPPCDCGVVFKLDKNGNETVLHSFQGNPDGYYPYAGLARDRFGNLYGTTWAGGGEGGATCYGLGCGTVFKVEANGNESVLHAFTGGSDGSLPSSALIVDKSGNLYGVAPEGGDLSCGWRALGCGVVFKLTLPHWISREGVGCPPHRAPCPVSPLLSRF